MSTVWQIPYSLFPIHSTKPSNESVTIAIAKVTQPIRLSFSLWGQFEKLAPLCTVEKRAAGEPQLAPQEKQLDILAKELRETLLCINVSYRSTDLQHQNIINMLFHSCCLNVLFVN